MINVKVDTRKLERLLLRHSSAIKLRSAFLMRSISVSLLRAQRERFDTANAGKWRSLAPLTALKTGRSKPLQGLSHRVLREHDKTSATILFRNTKDWSIDQHDQGFTSPAVKDKFMSVRFFSGGGKSFRERRASSIPARPIWLEEDRVTKIVNDATDRWVKRELS